MKKFLILLAVVGLIGACGGDDGENGADSGGESPTNRPGISNLEYSPQSAQIGSGGGAIQIRGDFDFTDAQGDVSSARFGGRDCNTGQEDYTDFPIGDVEGIKVGSAWFILTISTVECPAGTYTSRMCVFDEQGHQSNWLTGSFTFYE